MEEYQRLTTEEEMRLFLRQQMREHNTELADAAQKAGVKEPWEYARFQNAGYRGLYNGMDEDAIHSHKGLSKSQKILDHMGSTELAANLFRATQAAEKLKKDNVQGKANANHVHFEVGQKVRKAIADIGGTMPEDLPTAESIKKIESKQRKLEKDYILINLCFCFKRSWIKPRVRRMVTDRVSSPVHPPIYPFTS